MGGELHLNHEVKNIVYTNKKIECVEFKDGKKIDLSSDAKLISSLPITLTAKLLGYQSNLRFRGIRSVFLAYEVPEILPDGIHWLYYGSNKIDFNRVTEPKKLSAHVSPKDKTYLTAEITFSKGDDIDKMDSKSLISTAKSKPRHANWSEIRHRAAGTRGVIASACPVCWLLVVKFSFRGTPGPLSILSDRLA